MENRSPQGNRPTNPRRKQRSKFQIFKEAYLPFILVAAGFILVLTLVIGLLKGNSGKSPDSTQATGPSLSAQQLTQQVNTLLQQAQQLADSYDYDGALALLNTFQGSISDFPRLEEAIANYTSIQSSMVSWTADQVPNLSFHVLVANLEAALKDPTYGQEGNKLYNRNFISTEEFSRILQQLYDGGYVLVDLDDLYTTQYDASAGKSVYTTRNLKLPAGKKPIMLTETHCNYYTYMVDSDGDRLPDQDGAGFAYKLKYDGTFYNEMISENGTKITGSFDLVPVLENFILQHPDFSYKGARAILAFSGYDGIFGYRTHSDAFDQETRLAEQQEASALAQALRDAGYTLASYTYGNLDYRLYSASAIGSDLEKWNDRIVPIIGKTDILVFARESDIGTEYQNNAKFNVLFNKGGFRFYLGSSSFLYNLVETDYVRHNRLMVTGSTLFHHADRFEGILDPKAILDPQRGAIPE